MKWKQDNKRGTRKKKKWKRITANERKTVDNEFEDKGETECKKKKTGKQEGEY